MPNPIPATRPVQDSVDLAIARALVTGLGLWQAVSIAAVVTSTSKLPWWVLVVPHIVVGLLAVLASRKPPVVLLLLMGAASATAIDVSVATSVNSPLVLAAIWSGVFVAVAPQFVLGTSWAPLISALTWTAEAVVLPRTNPELLNSAHIGLAAISPASGLVVAGAANTAMAYILARVLDRLTSSVDDEVEQADRALHAVEVSRQSAREAAEDALLLHDTVVNTLGAIANGGVATEDRARVQARCADDVTIVGRRLAAIHPQVDELALDDLRGRITIDVDQIGIDTPEVAAALGALPRRIRNALVGAVREAVVNADKHAGVDRVTVEAERDDRGLRVRVVDCGVGFDGDPVPGRGIARSIVERARDAGISVSVLSAPGSGTTVELRVHDQVAETSSPDPSARWRPRLSEEVLARAVWLYAAGVVGVGTTIEVFERAGQGSAAYGMFALVGGVCVIAWWASRQQAALPAWVTVLLLAAVPPALLLAFAAVDFGRADAWLFQASGVTPLLAPVIARSRLTRPATTVITILVLTGVMIAVDVDHGRQAALILIALAPAIAITLGWHHFLGVFRAALATGIDARARAAERRREAETRQLLAVSRAQLRDAGLSAAMALLDAIALGKAVPSDPSVRRECAQLERHLRQILQLTTEAVHVERWLTQALAIANDRGVDLTLRIGDAAETLDDGSAAIMGRVVVEEISASHEGERVTVTMLPVERRVHLILVRPWAHTSNPPAPAVPSGWTATRTILGRQQLLEVVDYSSASRSELASRQADP